MGHSVAWAGRLGDMAGWPPWVLWSMAVVGLAVIAAGLWDAARPILGRGKRPRVSLVLVVQDAEATIEATLRHLASRYGRAGDSETPAYELVVVDSGSTDDTPRILAALEKRYQGFMRVARAPSSGFDSVRGGVTIRLGSCDRQALGAGRGQKDMPTG